MASQLPENFSKLQSRRQLLGWGIAGSGLLVTSTLLSRKLFLSSQPASSASVRIPPLPADYIPPAHNLFDPMSILRDFDYGVVTQENGQIIREFDVTANSSPLQLNSAISFVSWNLNNRVPGPTLRAKEGDRVRIRFHNQDGHSHSMHFHGIHPATFVTFSSLSAQ